MARRQGPKKPAHKYRTVQVTFWVTLAERDRISANAENAGVSKSAYIRSLSLGKPLRQKPRVLADKLIQELSRIGNNLNQLLRHAQAGRIDGIEHIEHVAARLSHALTYWTSGEATGGVAQETIALLTHEGAKLNGLAVRAHRRERIDEAQLLPILHELTDKLRPFCR